MTCIHIKQSLEKINNLISLMNNDNSSLYEKLGKYVREDEVDALLARLKTSCTVRTIERIRGNDLYNHLSLIFDILKSCECRNEMVTDYNQLVTRSKEMGSKQLSMLTELTSLRTKSDNYYSQLTDTRKLVENKEKEIARVSSKLDEKQQKVDSLLNRLAELKLESSEKAGELRRKDDEIKILKKNLSESQKDFLNEKLRSKQEKLETFVMEIEVELQKAQNLRRRYRNLISAQEEKRGNDITIAKENIEAIKEGLSEKGINNFNIKKLCRKCKKVAQLEVWIEKIQEQYEAKQEIPLYEI